MGEEMGKNEKIQEKINDFLKENKIKTTGGTIESEEQLSKVLNNLAMSDLKKGKAEKALYFANNALEFDPKNDYSFFVKGLIYRNTKKFNEAIESFKEYNSRSNDKVSLIYIGLCYAELNDIENALGFFNEAEKELSEEEKNENSSLLCTVYECMGNIYMYKENIMEFKDEDRFSFNYKLAVKYFKMSLKINANNHILLNKLASCYYHFEDASKALYCYEEAAKVAEDNTAYLEAIEEMKGMGVVAETVEF